MSKGSPDFIPFMVLDINLTQVFDLESKFIVENLLKTSDKLNFVNNVLWENTVKFLDFYRTQRIIKKIEVVHDKGPTLKMELSIISGLIFIIVSLRRVNISAVSTVELIIILTFKTLDIHKNLSVLNNTSILRLSVN